MVGSKDILLGIVGFGISFYGGFNDNQLALITGILIMILTMWLNIQEIEEDVKILKAQIHTKTALDALWREIDDIKKLKKRKI